MVLQIRPTSTESPINILYTLVNSTTCLVTCSGGHRLADDCKETESVLSRHEQLEAYMLPMMAVDLYIPSSDVRFSSVVIFDWLVYLDIMA